MEKQEAEFVASLNALFVRYGVKLYKEIGYWVIQGIDGISMTLDEIHSELVKFEDGR